MTPFINGYSAVEESLNHGVINSKGEIIIPIKYEDIII
jgi:hypothetical protein